MILSNLITAKVNLLAGMAIGVGIAILVKKLKENNSCINEKKSKISE